MVPAPQASSYGAGAAGFFAPVEQERRTTRAGFRACRRSTIIFT